MHGFDYQHVPRLTESWMWRPDKYMKQNPLVALIGPIRLMDSSSWQLSHPMGNGHAGLWEAVTGSQILCDAKHQVWATVDPYFV